MPQTLECRESNCGRLWEAYPDEGPGSPCPQCGSSNTTEFIDPRGGDRSIRSLHLVKEEVERREEPMSRFLKPGKYSADLNKGTEEGKKTAGTCEDCGGEVVETPLPLNYEGPIEEEEKPS